MCHVAIPTVFCILYCPPSEKHSKIRHKCDDKNVESGLDGKISVFSCQICFALAVLQKYLVAGRCQNTSKVCLISTEFMRKNLGVESLLLYLLEFCRWWSGVDLQRTLWMSPVGALAKARFEVSGQSTHPNTDWFCMHVSACVVNTTAWGGHLFSPSLPKPLSLGTSLNLELDWQIIPLPLLHPWQLWAYRMHVPALAFSMDARIWFLCLLTETVSSHSIWLSVPQATALIYLPWHLSWGVFPFRKTISCDSKIIFCLSIFAISNLF